MNLSDQIVTIFGGTGFVGRYIVAQIAKTGARIRVITRHPEAAYFLRPNGVVGQIVPEFCDYKDQKNIAHAIRGSSIVINCLGILFEKNKGDFERIHTHIPTMIAKECKAQNIARFIHISALSVDRAQSLYAKTKFAGENGAREAFSQTTILRPSVVFGAEDKFFNMFAKLSMFAPALPLIGGGKTLFQPVFVADIADAVMACIKDTSTAGKVYELGGPEVLSFRDIYQKLFQYTGVKRALVSLPWGIANIQARILSLMPTPLLTPDQVISLKTDNIIQDSAKTFIDLGIMPRSLDSVLPTYLTRYRPGGRFGDKKRA
jgi:uncharacterized protein YbjT (DUF2867 family)